MQIVFFVCVSAVWYLTRYSTGHRSCLIIICTYTWVETIGSSLINMEHVFCFWRVGHLVKDSIMGGTCRSWSGKGLHIYIYISSSLYQHIVRLSISSIHNCSVQERVPQHFPIWCVHMNLVLFGACCLSGLQMLLAVQLKPSCPALPSDQPSKEQVITMPLC